MAQTEPIKHYMLQYHNIRYGESSLPKVGFKSLTLSDTVYNRVYSVYESNKKELNAKGVNSFSGYVTSMLEETMQRDKNFAIHAPRIEEVSVADDQIILKDNISSRIAEIVFQNDQLYCYLCEKNDCIHIGYAFSIPAIYKRLSERGIRNPSL